MEAAMWGSRSGGYVRIEIGGGAAGTIRSRMFVLVEVGGDEPGSGNSAE